MKPNPSAPVPNLRSLFALFPPGDDLPEYAIVPADEVPTPYQELLVHEHHMTVTVEKFFGDQVDVRILGKIQEHSSYARKILLALHGSGRVVQFGIVRIQLDACGDSVRNQILEGKTPLGRILIQNDVLRRIEPHAFLRVIPNPALMAWFGLRQPHATYGRLALIYCNEKPAVELLEIVAPV